MYQSDQYSLACVIHSVYGFCCGGMTSHSIQIITLWRQLSKRTLIFNHTFLSNKLKNRRQRDNLIFVNCFYTEYSTRIVEWNKMLNIGTVHLILGWDSFNIFDFMENYVMNAVLNAQLMIGSMWRLLVVLETSSKRMMPYLYTLLFRCC